MSIWLSREKTDSTTLKPQYNIHVCSVRWRDLIFCRTEVKYSQKNLNCVIFKNDWINWKFLLVALFSFRYTDLKRQTLRFLWFTYIRKNDTDHSVYGDTFRCLFPPLVPYCHVTRVKLKWTFSASKVIIKYVKFINIIRHAQIKRIKII